MRTGKPSNFAFLVEGDILLYEIGTAAEAVFIADPNATLVKLRQLAEQLTRSVAAHLGIPSDRETRFFDLLGAIRERVDIDDKVFRLLHHIRRMGNEAVHEYKQDRGEAAKALRSARELCIWYFRTFCQPPSTFTPGPFVPPRDWQQEQNDQAQEIVRLQALLDRLQDDSAQKDALIQALRQGEEQLRALAEAHARDAAAAFELAEEQSARVDQLLTEDRARLANIRCSSAFAASGPDFSARSRRASEHIDAEWAPEISLREAFDEYQLTTGQEHLIRELDDFLHNQHQNIFILAGHAGTGKTFITKGLSDFLALTGRQVVLVAPTGKAARVMTRKSGHPASTIHKKIYSMDDIREYKSEDVAGSETFKLYAELDVNNDADNTVYIVDESSMVSDVYSEGEFFRFGSGRLLSDFLKYVNLDHNDHAKKIIFIGDSSQLPPIGMSSSPALDPNYLGGRQGSPLIRTFELSEVVRQKAGSGVLACANTIRDSLYRKNFVKLSLPLAAADVSSCADSTDLVERYIRASNGQVSDNAMIIASSNADVTGLNTHVRSVLFPGQESIAKRDKLVVVMNCVVNGTPLNNGDFVYVTDVAPTPESRTVTLRSKNKLTGHMAEEKVRLDFRKVQIAFRTTPDEVVRMDVRIIENLLYSDQPNLSSNQTKALYIDFRQRNPHLPNKGKILRDALLQDPYFNALRVKFGYALTCHKAQGSEWDDVFVQCRTHMNARTEGYFRWLYTAVTRASERLHLLNPPHLTIFDEMRPTPTPTPIRQGDGQPPRSGAAPDPHTPLGRASESPDQEGNVAEGAPTDCVATGEPVIDGIRKAVLRELADAPALKIEAVNHHAWQEAYYISDGARSVRINIAYKANGVVSSVVPAARDELSLAVASRLSTIRGLRFTERSAPTADGHNFIRNCFNEFWPIFLEQASTHRIDISQVIEEPWNLRISLGRNGDVGDFAVYCNASEQITRYHWIGRPPRDETLRETLEKVMSSLG